MDCLALYQKYLPNLKKGHGNQWRDNCPFHNEKTKKNKSFSVNMETGQYHCHSCDAKGNAKTFATHFGERTNDYRNRSKTSGYNYDLKNVNTYHNNLLDNIEYAPRSWNVKYIKLLKVGWNPSKNNLVFPIFDNNNKIINVKHHHGLQFKGASTTLYPIHFLDTYGDSYIIIAEGEKDTITLLSQGLQAVTSTGGSKTIPNDISQLLTFQNIYICLDNDDPGDAGTDLWIKKIRELKPKSNIRFCDLSKFVVEGSDVTDYFGIDDKSQQTFKDEVLDRSVWARIPGTDVPIYSRKIMMSGEAKNLSRNCRLIMHELILRATRYRVKTSMIHGMRVRMRPGEYITSCPLFADICGKGMTGKKVRGAIEKLKQLRFIQTEDLKKRRGLKITLNNWIDENGHSESHSDLDKTGIQNIKFLSPDELIDKLNNGHSE